MIALTGGDNKPYSKQNTLNVLITSSDQLENSSDVNDRQMDTGYLQTMNLKL